MQLLTGKQCFTTIELYSRMRYDRNIPSHRITVRDIDIHYKCAGKGFPLILIHGGGNDWHEWYKNIPYLSEHFRVYAPDLPGYGLSQFPDFPVSPSWFAGILSGFMEALGIDSAHVIGHSMGGLASLHLSLSYPDKVNRLVLIDSAGFGEIAKKANRRLAVIRRIKRLAGKEKSLRYMDGTADEWYITERMQELNVPTVIIWGERDSYFPLSIAEKAKNAIQGAQLFVLPRCRHAPQRDDPDKFHDIVHRFLVEKEL
ncbi:MAG: alpha/beta fold hydrolase [Dehalococcoidia bacterium]